MSNLTKEDAIERIERIINYYEGEDRVFYLTDNYIKALKIALVALGDDRWEDEIK